MKIVLWNNNKTKYVYDSIEDITHRIGEYEVMSMDACIKVFRFEQILKRLHPIRFDRNPYHIVSIVNELNSEIRKKKYENEML